MAKMSRREWVSVIEALEESGELVSVFARARGLNPKSVWWWRWRFRKEAEECSTPAHSEPAFFPVVVQTAESSLPAPPALGLMEASLPNGVVLRWEQRLERAALREVVFALAEVRP
jgi:hypothetical protein